jgi:hypothetical protein
MIRREEKRNQTLQRTDQFVCQCIVESKKRSNFGGVDMMKETNGTGTRCFSTMTSMSAATTMISTATATTRTAARCSARSKTLSSEWGISSSKNLSSDEYLRRFVWNQAKWGASRREVVSKLIEMGLIRSRAAYLVSSVYSALQSSEANRKACQSELVKNIGLSVMALAFLVALVTLLAIVPNIPYASTLMLFAGVSIYGQGVRLAD